MATTPARVLVPICGDAPDQDALEVGCMLAKKRKGMVEAVFVIEVSRSLPLDAEMQVEIERGEAVLQRAEKVAEEQTVGFESSLLQARDVGAAIVDAAVQNRAEAIVLGLGYKTKFGEYSMGATASYVLKNAPCRVVLTRQAIPA